MDIDFITTLSDGQSIFCSVIMDGIFPIAVDCYIDDQEVQFLDLGANDQEQILSDARDIYMKRLEKKDDEN